MWLFLSTEIMFFAALIGTYIVIRFGAVVWPTTHAVQLKPERQGERYVVTIPEHRVWTVLVWNEPASGKEATR